METFISVLRKFGENLEIEMMNGNRNNCIPTLYTYSKQNSEKNNENKKKSQEAFFSGKTVKHF